MKNLHHNDRNHEASLYLLEQGELEKSFPFIYDLNYWNGGEALYDYAKKLSENLEPIKQNPEAFRYYVDAARAYPKEFGFKSADEVYETYLPYWEDIYKNNPKYKIEAIVNLITYYRLYKPNYKKQYELFTEYFNLSKDSNIENYEYYVISAEKLGKEIPISFFKTARTANHAYNALTDFLEFANELDDKEPNYKEKSLYYLEIAKMFGKYGYDLYCDYFEKGLGDSRNNERHNFAMFCNNYAIVLRKYYWFLKGYNSHEHASETVHINFKGYEYSPFWENINNGMEAAHNGLCAEEIIQYSPLWLKEMNSGYYDEYIEPKDFIEHYRHLVASYSHLKQHEKADETWQKLINYFIELNDETVDIIELMLQSATAYFSTYRENEQFHKRIQDIEDFFSNPVYERVCTHLAIYTKHSELGRAYEELNDLEKMAYHYKIALETYETHLPNYYYDHQAELERLRHQINVAQGMPDLEKQLKNLYQKHLKGITHFSTYSESDKAQYLLDFAEHYTHKNQNLVEEWVDDDVFVRLVNREPREDDEECVDTTLYHYEEKEGFGVSIEAIEVTQKKRGFLGFGTKESRRLEFHITFHENYVNGEAEKNTPYDELPPHLQAKCNRIYDEWMTKYIENV